MKSHGNSTNSNDTISSLKDKATFNDNNPTMDDDYLFAASTCDCTGLIPSVAHNEAEAASYDEIAHYLPPVQPVPMPGVIGNVPSPLPEATPIMTPSTTPRTPETDAIPENNTVSADSPAEGIHAEVNTLDKNTSSKEGLEGNHLL